MEDVQVGRPHDTAADNGPLSGTSTTVDTNTRPMYGLSAVFRVADAPGAPTGLTALPNGETQINLSWTAPADPGESAITGYRIEVSADNRVTWTDLVADTGNTDTTAAHTGLTAGDVRHYRVSAISDAGTGPASSVVRGYTRAAPTPVPSNWSLNPAGSMVGDSFRLLFLSSTKRDGTSADIDDYNTFIQERALAGDFDIRAHSAAFRAVGCTSSVDARDNSATIYSDDDKGVPIYWLNGNQAADDYEDFYDGDWDEEQHDKDESGNNGPNTSQVANKPYTGCDHDGTEKQVSGVSRALGRLTVGIGSPHSTVSGNGPLSGGSTQNTNTRPFYGLSAVFRVSATAATVPGAPTGLLADGTSQTQVDLSWTAPASTGGVAIRGYKVEFSADNGSTWTDAVADTGSADPEYSHTGRTAGTVYHYRVSAINSVGTGPVSAIAITITATTDGTFTVPSAWALNPTGVAAGSSFRLLFLTTAKRDGSSTDIADYNTFVHSRAAVGHSALQLYASHFKAVGCTEDDDARDNTSTTYTATDKGVPIYWVSGEKVADEYEDFYDGSWNEEADDRDPSGAAGPDTSVDVNYPLTGCGDDGTEAFSGTDSRALGASFIQFGRPNSTTTGHGPIDGHGAVNPVSGRPMYGLSPVFNVPAAPLNSPPAFDTATATRSVPENTTDGQNIGAAVAATDADGDTLTYTLEGTDAASFDIVSSSGQLQTKSGVTYDHEAKDTYSVTVKATDTSAATATIAVTITVTDVAEPPAAPAAPTVTATSGSNTSLDVTWSAPANAGKPAITGYDLQYREGTSGPWTAGPQDVTTTSTSIASLTAGTLYQVQVRATNDEGDSPWSAAGSATTTSPTNSPPEFATASATRSVAENTAANQDIGAALTATDDDGDTLAYTLEGTDAASFDIDSGTGQLSTKSGVTYDHEAKSSYSVTVKADDSNGGTATIAVTITVTDVDEPPDAPAAPTVSATSGSTTSLDVSWSAPANAGRPAITGYDLQYREGTSGNWTNGPQAVSGTSSAIASLTAGTSYQVRVRATNNEGDSDWSAPGSGTTSSTTTAATGKPTITGPAQVGMTLTAGTDDIMDADGLNNVTYTYRWRRGSDDISGATSSTYTPDAADLGEKLTVRVEFTDDASNPETLLSDETQQVAPAAAACPTDSATVWCATLTVGHSLDDPNDPSTVDAAGYEARAGVTAYGSLSGATFSHLGVDYTVTQVLGAGATQDLYFATSPNLPADGAGLTVHVQTYGGELDAPLSEVEFDGITNHWDFTNKLDHLPSTPLSEVPLLRAGFQRFALVPGPPDLNTAVRVRLSYAAPAAPQADVPSNWALNPSGLTTGDTFRLLFVTSTTVSVESTDIAVYNTFVQGRAAAGHAAIQGFSSLFRAVASTASVDARDNTSTTGTGVPIYWLGGAKLADNYADFYDGSWDDEANRTDESGNASTHVAIATGSNHDGTEHTFNSLSRGLGSGAGISHGTPNASDPAFGPLRSETFSGGGLSSALYALSPVFTVTSTVSITTVTFGAASYTASEGGPAATVAVDLSQAPSSTVTIPLATTHLGGATAADYTGVPASLTFQPGQTRRTFAVTAVDDTDNDDGESVRIRFGTLPSGFVAGAPVTATVALADDDGPVREVFFDGADDLTVRERSIKRIYVYMDEAPSARVTIPLTKTHLGGATAADYGGVPASLTFPAGQRSRWFELYTVDDDDNDDNEAVRLGFGTLPAGVRTSTAANRPPTKTVHLEDNDGVEIWEAWFGQHDYTATEGGAAARVSIHLHAPVEIRPLDVHLRWRYDGGATAADHGPIPETVQIAVGRQTTSFTVAATDDSEDDDLESVTLWIGGNIYGPVIPGEGPRTATVALRDNDGVRPVAVSFGAATYTAVEGGATATVRVTLDRAPGRSVTIPITTTHLGNANSADHSGIPASVTFGSGATARSFTVTATDDSTNDDGGSVRLAFGTLPDGVSRGSLATTTVNLEDDDGNTPRMRVDFDAHYLHIRTMSEGGSSVYFKVGASRRVPYPVTIPLAVTHTGGATPADYQGLPATVTIETGEDEVGVSMRAVDDTIDDDGEGIRVDFGDLPAGVTAGGWGTWMTYNIIDNDGPRNAVLSDGWVDGSDLTLIYTDPLDPDPALARRDFVVLAGPGADAATVAVESVKASGSELTLKLARPVNPEEPVALTYLAAPMHPLRTARGAPAEAPADFPVRNQTSLAGIREELPDPAKGGGLPAATLPLPAALAAADGAELLDLSGRGLTDLAPLAGLTSLRELDLRDNAIADLAPLAGLTGLRKLHLQGNAITDLAPLAGLAALQELHLRGNRIADIAPLAGLEQLQALDLSDNRIEEVWPLAGLAALRELHLKGNLIADIGPLSGLAQPRVLDLSGNRIEEAWPLAWLPGLRRLDLSDNRIADIAPLAGLHALEVLLLDGNAAADLGPLASLQGLQNLGLSANRVADVTALAKLRMLRRLDLSGNALMDVSALEELSALEWLRLPGNPVSDADPVGRLPSLRWLWLDPQTPWSEPAEPRSGPDQGPALRVERTADEERRGAY